MKNIFNKKEYWLKLLNLKKSEIPDTLIIYGSWFALKVIPLLEKNILRQRETSLPNVFLGKMNCKSLLYSVLFGPSAAGTLTHLAGILNFKRIILIGSCGALPPAKEPIVLPNSAKREEGVSDWYLPKGIIPEADQDLLKTAKQFFLKNKIGADVGPVVTISHMLMESKKEIMAWKNVNLLGIDMETATVYSIANYFKIPVLAILVKAEYLMSAQVNQVSKNERMRTRDAVIKCALDLIKK